MILRLLPLLALLGLAACDEAPGDVFQGYVEADLLFVGGDEAGRLASLAVAEGDQVAAGQPLFTLDQALERAARDRAAAEVAAAAARLARLQAAQQRPAEIAVLQAEEARVTAELALAISEYDRMAVLEQRGNASRASLDQARATRDRTQAMLREIQGRIALATLPSHELEIAAAKGELAAAEAALDQAEVALARRVVLAPAAGLVQELYYRPGEVAEGGRAVVALLPPEALKLRFYVPQARLPALAAGTRVSVTCDGCGAAQGGRVVFIAAEAEFTPPVIYSLEERQKLVFLVEALPDEPIRLRVGQPVEVRLAP